MNNRDSLPSGWSLEMSCRLKHLGFNLHYSSPGLPNTLFWRVGSCICGLFLRSWCKGPYLGEVPHHKRKINKENQGQLYLIVIGEI